MSRTLIRILAVLAIPILAVGTTAQSVTTGRLVAKVEVRDGVATTRLEQTIHNSGTRVAEADWLLPLPAGAVADGFEMTADGKKMTGEVLSADRARSVYETIVRQRRDPGLLEYVGRGCLRARVFPIPANGEVQVQVTFRHVLPELGGLVRWEFDCGAAGIGGLAPHQVVLDFTLHSQRTVRNAFSPTPGVDVVMQDDKTVRASFEAEGTAIPARLAVYYGLTDAEFGLDVLTYRRGEADGYFLMMLSPKRQRADAETLPRSITFVLDTSGSMRGERIEQARGALIRFLESLRDQDRFNVVTFSTEPIKFFETQVVASPENIATALGKVRKVKADGGTNLEGGIRAGTPDRGPDGRHVPICVLLSDGEPTVGVVDPGTIVATAKRVHTEARTRVFVFGVGDSVNAVLLDSLAEQGRGERHYVRSGENIEEKASDLFAKLSSPVLTDLQLVIDGAETSKMSPPALPDLFAGSRLTITGRYARSGEFAVRLRGRMGEVAQEYVYEASFADGPTGDDFVPSLWAERRVGLLLDAIRLNGASEELVSEVRLLGTEFGIVTPYTSNLVLEDDALLTTGGPGSGRRIPYRGPGDVNPTSPGGPYTPGPSGPSTPGPSGPATGGTAGPGATTNSDIFFMGSGKRGGGRERPLSIRELGERLRDAGVLPADAGDEQLETLARQVAEEMQRSTPAAAGKSTGKDAVDASVYLDSLMRREAAHSPDVLTRLFTRRVGDRAFTLKVGIWTDTAYDAEAMKDGQRVIEAYSDDYFTLLQEHPELRRILALSDRLIVVLDGAAIEIQPPVEKPADTRERVEEGDGKPERTEGPGSGKV